MKKITKNTASILGVLFFLVLLMGSTGPQPEVLDRNVSSKIYTDKDGNSDAGYRAIYVLANTGSAGKIDIRVNLFCSEGTYSRTETIFFQEDEKKQLIYDFPEPSWLSDNVKVYIDAKAVREK